MAVIRLVSPPLRERLVQHAKQLLFASGFFLPMLMFDREGSRDARTGAAYRTDAVSAKTHVAVIHANSSTQRLIKDKN